MSEQSDNTTDRTPPNHMADPPPLIAAYLRKRADLVRFFTLRMRSAALAEDLVQDLFLKLSATAAPDDLQNPEAFLYRVATNLMLDRAKQQHRQAARDGSWNRETVGDAPEPASMEAPADEALASRQELQRLREGVERLPPQIAAAFRLHKFEGLSHIEVAVRLGVSRSSVEKYIMTALRTLMAELGR